MITINTEKFLLALAESSSTSKEIAEKAGVSRVVVSKIINGRQLSARPQTLGKIAKALNVKVEDLM